MRSSKLFFFISIDSTKKDISLLLQEDISELEVSVEFSVFNNRNDAINFWCDKINLIIIYGSYLEFLKSNITTNNIYIKFLQNLRISFSLTNCT